MNCRNSLNSLSAYVDRELSGEQMLALRSHIERCPECKAEYESLKTLKTELAALPMHEPPQGLDLEVIRMVRRLQPAKSRTRMSWALLAATSVAAAALAVLTFNAFFALTSESGVAEAGDGFDAETDSAVVEPNFGGHAPILPVGR